MADITVTLSAGPGAGVPSGGTTGQSLVKSSNTNYATEWSSVTMSAAAILAALLTVDGAGSGLDADLLDGQSSAAFEAAGAAATAQAAAVQRANHTGSQASTTISDFAEAVQDVLGALGLGGVALTFTYDDGAGTAVIDVNVDNSTIEVSSDSLRVKDAGITAAKLAQVYARATAGGEETLSTVAAAGATETLDLANGNAFDVTLDENVTLTFPSATNGKFCAFTLILRQDGTGTNAVTWPNSSVLKWTGGAAPTVPTTASAIWAGSFWSVNGSLWHGAEIGTGYA